MRTAARISFRASCGLSSRTKMKPSTWCGRKLSGSRRPASRASAVPSCMRPVTERGLEGGERLLVLVEGVVRVAEAELREELVGVGGVEGGERLLVALGGEVGTPQEHLRRRVARVEAHGPFERLDGPARLAL